MASELEKIVNLKGVPTDHEHYCPICGRLVPKFEFDWKNSKGEIEHHVVQPICKCEAEADDREREQMRNRYRKEQFEQNYSALGDRTNNYTECSFENFEVDKNNKASFTAAQKFLESYPYTRNLYIYGAPGNGKSHLAAAIANSVKAQSDKIVIYTTFVDALEKLRAAMNKGKDSEDKIMGALTCCDLLILDDVGVEKASEFTCDVLYRIIDRRTRSGMPIVFTSNYEPDNLAERYKRAADEMMSLRIVGRIVDNATVVCNWAESRRKPLLQISDLEDSVNQF